MNYVSYSFTPGYVATAILYYNSTPTLVNLLSPYISYKFSSLTLSFSTTTAAMFSNFPIPAPQLLSNYIPGKLNKKNDKLYFGYKLHTLVAGKSSVILNYLVTAASDHDSQTDLSIP
ncbi:MAG: transposase [Thermoplasmatales archaeon]